MTARIVGSGLSGATAAVLLKAGGFQVEMFETRPQIAGNCFDRRIGGILQHGYGPHLFHTNDAEVWRFLSRFTEWTGYRHRVVADTAAGRISIPYNTRTRTQVGRELTDEEIRKLIFVEYSEKQWGVAWEAMPAAIIGRVPARRHNDDDRYFTDEFQGQPKDGFTKMFERMLEGIPVHLRVGKDDWRRQAARADLVIYTGKIDEHFHCCHGRLPYRSLRFEHFWSPQRLPQAVINQCNRLPFTRIYDHRYFSENEAPSLPSEWARKIHPQTLLPACAVSLGPSAVKEGGTILTREYPQAHDGSNEPYYPMPFGEGMALYQKYKRLADAEPRTVFVALPRIVWEFSRQRKVEFSEEEENADAVVCEVAEPSGGGFDCLDHAVKAFGQGVADGVCEPVEQARQAGFETLAELLHRLQPAALGAPIPLRKIVAPLQCVVLLPKSAKEFFDFPSP